MARSALTGTRVRERRLLVGMKQADLARAAGISPAYLNLIEHNRRRVGPELLAGLAKVLGAEATTLAEGAEAAIFESLREAASGATTDDHVPEIERIEEFLGRFPGWAALLASRQARLTALERSLEAMNERMAHDPFLSASLHEVVSAVTSVRSTAAILAETDDIDPEWRARFHLNIYEDSIRLSEAAAALVAYLDASQESETGLLSPQEEVEAWLERCGYHPQMAVAAGPDADDAYVAGVPELASTAARKLALAHLARSRQDAELLPQDRFGVALAEIGPDPGLLARHLGVGLGPIFRRLATGPQDDADAVAAGLVACDGSGTLTFRKPALGFALPRFGAACPLWPLYEALARPGVPLRAVIEMAGRVPQRFEVFAFGELRHPQGFDGPTIAEASMLVLPAATLRSDSERLVGSSCRVCPRAGCAARREPSILAEGV